MADLYFKVKADYEELVRMQQEANRLKGELAEASTKADFTRLTNELGVLQNKMKELAENGAQNFIDKFKEMGDGSPDFFKGFDSAFATFSSNAVSHFDVMKQQYVAMMNELIDKADELERSGNSPKMLAQVRDLTDEIEKQIAVCERGKEIWSGMYDNASVDALGIIREQRQEEEKKLAVMEQELEVARQQAEASKMSLGDKIGATIAGGSLMSSRFLGGVQDPYAQQEEAQAALEQATQAYEAQKQVVAELRAEEESLSGQLSATAQAQMEEASAAEQSANDRQAYIDKLRETQGEASKAKDSIREVVGEGTAADQALKMDSLKEGFNQATQSLQELKDELTSVLQQYKDAQAELSNLESKMMSGDTSISVEDVEAARAKVAELRQGLEDTAFAYNNINGQVQEYKSQLDEASGHQVRMRTQIMQAREDMMRMIAAGQQGTPVFQQLAIKAGEMRRQMNLANAQMQYFANPTRHLAAMKTGLQGVAGAVGLVNGVIGLFNDKSEKMAEIQTKVQSVMAVVVGLETTYNLVKKTSAIQMALSEVATLADAAAKRVLAIGTAEATAAQEALNVAMSANPFGAVIAVVTTLAAAIYGLVSALSDANSETTLAENINSSFEKQIDSQTKTLAGQILKYRELQKRYQECGNDSKKLKKFIDAEQSSFRELGLKIQTVDGAHRMLGKNSGAFERASINRAIVLAQEAAAAEEIGKTIASLSKIYKKFIRGEEVDFVDLRNAVKEAMPHLNDKGADRLLKFYGFEQEKDFLFGNATGKDVVGSMRDLTEHVMSSQLHEYEKMREDMLGSLFKGDKGGLEVYENMESPTEPKEKKGSKAKQKEAKSERKEEQKINQEKAKADDELYERQEDLRKQAVEKRKRELQNEIKLESDSNKKRAKQQELAQIESEEFFREQVKREMAYQKKLYDERNKNTNNKVSFYKSQEFHKFMLQEQDKYNKSMKALNLSAFKNEIEIAAHIMEVQDALAAREDLDKSLKSLEQFFDKRIQTEKKYLEKQATIEATQKNGAIGKDEAKSLIDRLNEERQAELDKEAFSKYKNNPLFEVAMSDTSMDFTKIKEIRDGMTDMMNKAMSTAEPSDFKGILDSYVKITDVMIRKNPFEVMKSSALDLKIATEELKTETKALDKLYADLGTNAAGEEKEGGILYGRRKDMESAQKAQHDATEAVEKAKAELADAQMAFNTLSPKEQELQRGTLKDAYDEVARAINRETQAKKDYNKASQAYYSEKDRVTAQEKKVAKTSQKQTAAQNANNKATKQAVKLVKDWANALKEAADMFNSPIASAVSGMANLTATTLDSIEAMKQSGYGAAKGVEKVAAAVQNSIAILAIIQAAWQVIQTIMSLFQGEDTEQKQIDVLEAKIKALDYQFNKLKEDMDKAWGTEALDLYIKTLNSLNAKQATTMEVIQAKAGKSKSGFLGIGGHHSLASKMNDIIGSNSIGGITNAELEAAKRVLQSLGVDTSKGNLLDWIYQLSPENMASFLASAAGNAVVAKLGAVTAGGDYQGADWLSDLQNYASTAKDAEDITLAMAEKLNGISLSGLKDEFKSLVTTMTTSLNDINNSFDAFMREAMYNKLRDKYEERVESFNEELKDLNDLYTRGELTDEEYRKRLQALRDKWKRETQEAQDEYQAQLTAAGVNAEDVEQSATSGGFEAMSEDTATELNGRFASMQAMETVTAEGITQLIGMQTNIVSIADEIRNVQVNSYLELQAISENTRKIVNPILEMQDNVKLIKENTDKL